MFIVLYNFTQQKYIALTIMSQCQHRDCMSKLESHMCLLTLQCLTQQLFTYVADMWSCQQLCCHIMVTVVLTLSTIMLCEATYISGIVQNSLCQRIHSCLCIQCTFIFIRNVEQLISKLRFKISFTIFLTNTCETISCTINLQLSSILFLIRT